MGLLDEYFTPPGSPSRSAEQSTQDTRTLDAPVPMLDLVLANGSRAAFPYATLLRAVLVGDRMELTYSTDTVLISGRRLGELYKAVTQHRAGTIVVTDARGIDAKNASAVVTRIEITAA